MKRLILSILAVAFALSLSAQTTKQRIEWRFSTKRTAHYVEKGHYHSTIGKGTIEFVGKKCVATVGYRKYIPAAEGVRKGDYWLISIPVEDLKAGTAVDIWFPFLAVPYDTPHAFAFEYLDGKKWKAVTPADKKGVNCYSTTSKTWPRFLWQTIRLENDIKKGNILIRLRHCDKGATKSTLYGSGSGMSPRVTVMSDCIQRDTTRILFIGNSYTYFNLYPMQFKEIAWNEGHYIDAVTYLHGGYTMKQHLANQVSRETVEQGGFDYAFLQDQSLHSLRIGTTADQDVVGQMGKMRDQVLKYSPNAKCLIELTWGRKNGNDATKAKKLRDLVEAHPEYFTDYYTNQRYMVEKTTYMAQQLNMGISPVGLAWEIVRRERPDIELYTKDCYHPSDAGSYLSAAVGYLTIFKEPFKADTPVRLNREVAAYLRSVAERVVLNKGN